MMQYKGYLSRVEFDDEANLFHGEASVDDYLAFCAERGEAPDPPFSGRLTIRLSPEQHRKVILAATRAGKPLNQWTAEVLDHATRLGA